MTETGLSTQPSAAPTRKVTAGAIGSGVIGIPLATVIVNALAAAGVELPPGSEAALGALLSSVLGFIASYFTRDRSA